MIFTLLRLSIAKSQLLQFDFILAQFTLEYIKLNHQLIWICEYLKNTGDNLKWDETWKNLTATMNPIESS